MTTRTSYRAESPETIDAVRTGILTWFERHRRTLPWRETRDPYHILVSEVMLQQTQVDRVIPYYHRFLERFPTVQELASAPVAEVIRLWAGLGYNRRAVNLQRAAQAVVASHNGTFPRDLGQLRALPGVGEYTAGAIACFAFEQDVAFADTNMRRVLDRVFTGETGASWASLSGVAERLVPAGDGWRWNQALMEFGALHCTSRKPLCGLCPLQAVCVAFPVAQQPGTRKPAKQEESFVGSNRFYRGRILAVLRDHPDTAGVTLHELGAQVRDDFSSEQLPWLVDLVRGLESDGLARVAEPRETYDASPPETRIALP
jgi:A/G-specific adenine glycosylase